MGNVTKISSLPFYEICIDAKEITNISGKMYCGLLPEGVEFIGVEQLIFQMENIMNLIKFPESTTEKRLFALNNTGKRHSVSEIQKRQREMRKFNSGGKKGEIGTVVVRIQFRQNSSWQGIAQWVEGEKTFLFESEMDFVKILDSIEHS